MQLLPVDIQDLDSMVARAADSGDWPWTRQELVASLSSDHQCLYAVHRGEKIGYCVLLNNSIALEILHIVVFSRFRRQRLGTALLDAIGVYAMQAELPALWLEVREDNLPALNLYRSYGFVEQRRRRNYYGSADAINMAYAL